ncbi:polyphosphate polymerase domain-containing protein [Verrucomicrobiales bacterium]|nr:polyphosphate polymerase domain-containing protein [Verrucomicrobiales bacterium]
MSSDIDPPMLKVVPDPPETAGGTVVEKPAPLLAPPTPRLDVASVGPSRKGAKDQVIERFEQKYIVHPRVVPQIRKYLKPFVIADPNGAGDIPEYAVTTLQLDTDTMDLALAKERKALSRFKLRIRTYGTKPDHPVFFELKRKVNGVIIKSRAKMRLGDYNENTVRHPETAPVLKTAKDNSNFLEFCRIANLLNARPKMFIRYIRESYFGANDDYARITFDRRVSYRPTREWMFPGPEYDEWKYWRSMDTQTGLNRDFAGYIFELKAMRNAPRWMVELVERFNISTTGFCKYATAYRLETLYRGATYSAQSENTTLVD